MFRYQCGDDNPRQRAEQSQFGQQQYRGKDHIWVTTCPLARLPLWPAVINVHDPEHIFRAEEHGSDDQYAGQQIPADKRMRDNKRDEHCASFRRWLERDYGIAIAFQHCRRDQARKERSQRSLRRATRDENLRNNRLMALSDRLKKFPRDLFGQAVFRTTVGINLELGRLRGRLARKEDPLRLRLSRDPDTLGIFGGTRQVSRSRVFIDTYGYLRARQLLLHSRARPSGI